MFIEHKYKKIPPRSGGVKRRRFRIFIAANIALRWSASRGIIRVSINIRLLRSVLFGSALAALCNLWTGFYLKEESMPAVLTEEEFSRHVNTKFHARLDAEAEVDLELAEVKGYQNKAIEQTALLL